jgi:spoIIIJ-associated protein
MELNDIRYTVKEEEGDNVTFTFEGEDIGVLIGHHGETLDSLQYLVGLASNRRKEGNYCRITLDGGSYREKRAETLKELAKKIGEKVKRTGRSQMLEPMNPYERRIIHAVVSEIPGVYSKSKGEDPNRRVIIISENPRPNHYGNKRGNGGNRRQGQGNSNYRGQGQRSGGYTKTRSNKPTIEQMLKEDKDYVNRTSKQKNDDQLDAKLFSKIELD